MKLSPARIFLQSIRCLGNDMKAWSEMVSPKTSREAALYLIFGGLTTLVNFVVHFAASLALGLPAWLSAAIAWAAAVCFAFTTNKTIVFKNKTKGAQNARQFALFIAARVLSGIAASGAMFIFVDNLLFNEIAVFALVQIFVITFNYAASKWFIFR